MSGRDDLRRYALGDLQPHVAVRPAVADLLTDLDAAEAEVARLRAVIAAAPDAATGADQ